MKIFKIEFKNSHNYKINKAKQIKCSTIIPNLVEFLDDDLNTHAVYYDVKSVTEWDKKQVKFDEKNNAECCSK